MSTIFGLLAALCGLLSLLILARVLLTWIPGVNPYNPVVRTITLIVDPVLYPFRKLLPRFGMIDLSPVLALITIGVLGSAFSAAANSLQVSATALLLTIVYQLIRALITIACVIVLIRVLLSLFHADPWHPLTVTIREISRPLVRPFAGIAPQSGSIDTTAVIAFVAYLILYFLATRALLALFNSILGTPNFF